MDAASVEIFRAKLHSEPSVPELAVKNELISQKASEAPSPLTLQSLACYRLSLECFSLPFFFDEGFSFSKRCVDLRREVLEALGAGFFSYGQLKVVWYQRARSCVGAIVGLLQSDPAAIEKHQDTLFFLEKKLLPAFSSLLKKMERSRNFPKAKHEPRPTRYF